MKLPIRLRAWHGAIMEDANGEFIGTAACVPYAEMIVEAVNATGTPAERMRALCKLLANESPGNLEAMQDALRDIRADFTVPAQERHVAAHLYDAFARGKLYR